MNTLSRLLLATALAIPLYAVEADPWDALTAASGKPPAEAETALEDLLRHAPGFHAARFNLGTLLLTKDPARAAEQLTLATASSDPELAADAWRNLALARWHQGRLDEALQAAEDAVRLQPANAALRDELRRVALARADAARRAAEEQAKKLAVDSVELAEARVGEAYRAALPVHGGTGLYHVALPPVATPAAPLPAGTTIPLDEHGAPAGAPTPAQPVPVAAPPSPLPPGLTLGADGVISGTPSAAGTFRVPLLAIDAAKGEARGTVTITVLPQPAVTTASLPEAILGQPYSAPLAAVGLRAPRWRATGLPPGLTCDPSGVLRGVPTATGTGEIALTASEEVVPPAAPREARRSLPLTVSDSFAPDAQPAPATAGAAYEHRVGVRGPEQQYTWSAPDGPLAVDRDGLLHGTPAAEGTITRPATIHAADGRTRDVMLSVPVNPRPLIATSEPIRLRAGQPVDVPLPSTGGTAPFTWKALDGALPPGVRLDPDGHLRGVAKDPGSYTVTAQLEDRWKARTQSSLALTVEPAEKDEAKKDDGKKDEKKDPSKDGQQGKEGDQAKDQGKDPGKDRQSGPDQGKDPGKDPGKDGKDGKDQGKDGNQAKDGDQGKDGQQGKDGAKDLAKDQGKPGQPPAGKDGAKDGQAEQAAQLNQLAADRWLDQLPAENREVLRYQLLDGGERKPEKQGKSW